MQLTFGDAEGNRQAQADAQRDLRGAAVGEGGLPDRGEALQAAHDQEQTRASLRQALGTVQGQHPGEGGTSVPRGEVPVPVRQSRSEEHTSELQSLMRISYAVFCL